MKTLPELPDLASARRPLVVVAHPDDEVLGCGILLTRLRQAVVIHVTDGAPRDGEDARRHGFGDPRSYAAARWEEARRALDLVGVPATRHFGLGVADQEAAHHLSDVVRRLVPHVSEADMVFTHAFEGGHPDHDAVAFAVSAAVRLSGRSTVGLIVEMPFYHAGHDGWIRQRFLAHDGASRETCLALTADEIALKRRMAACHRTQGATLDGFSLDLERFRRAPAYDFEILPNGGALLYERHGWNLTGARWQQRVRKALDDLGCSR